MHVLKKLWFRPSLTKVIVMTENNARENALKVIQMGAYDYFLKPMDMNKLKVIVGRASYLSEIENDIGKSHTIWDKDTGFAGMIGQSPEMQRVFDIIKKVAATECYSSVNRSSL